ncbi:TRAP-type C4-dicarboxylate transport system, large permease component [Alloalcanivorax xenomutans]|uniref:TRAP transporter large permease n=1 Tax=Alloalcanivorax xenomutans TaxID=1094342 RepID=UPI0006D5BE7A|nr:TRAP transporter large permease [Alloalcanivorax xenomutans]CUR46480.1 TRAP-type C4-dicarboxylate transport system, large permease component [Alloalcanivorax xenomutans]
MIGAILIVGFLLLMLAGVPIAVALGIAGTVIIVLTGMDMPWFGLFTLQQSFNASIGKYPLLALPMFVLVGSAFDRSGVAVRIINFATAVVGRGPGMLPIVAIVVAMMLGGISGSSVAVAAAIGGVMIGAMRRAGYPPAFSATVIGSATATDILIPPSLAFIVYSIMVPGVALPDLFMAGLVPGVLAGCALIVPAWWLSKRHGFGATEADLPRPPFWKSLREASWGLVTPVLILGGMRAGWFTPTEAAVVAAFYVLFIGIFIHKTIGPKELYEIFADSIRTSAVVMIILGFAGVFAYCVDTAGLADLIVHSFQALGLGGFGTLLLILIVLALLGILLDGVTLFLVFIPVLLPLMLFYDWDPTWFGVLMTMVLALGQFTPPMAGTLLISCRLANIPIEKTIPWAGWFIVSFALAIALVLLEPQVALWLPQVLSK